jgi:hypothetical protein
MWRGHPPAQGKRQEENVSKTSLRRVSLHVALALAVAGILASSISPARAAAHPPTLATETGWPSELVNRPMCGSDHDNGPACEAGRRQ